MYTAVKLQHFNDISINGWNIRFYYFNNVVVCTIKISFSHDFFVNKFLFLYIFYIFFTNSASSTISITNFVFFRLCIDCSSFFYYFCQIHGLGLLQICMSI